MTKRQRKSQPREHSPDRAPAHRTETVTVEIGSYNGQAIHLTYTIEASLWTGPHGLGGFVSVRPGEVHIPGGSEEEA